MENEFFNTSKEETIKWLKLVLPDYMFCNKDGCKISVLNITEYNIDCRYYLQINPRDRKKISSVIWPTNFTNIIKKTNFNLVYNYYAVIVVKNPPIKEYDFLFHNTPLSMVNRISNAIHHLNTFCNRRN